jgi:hypothetical protein
MTATVSTFIAEVDSNNKRMTQINRYYELKYDAYKTIGYELAVALTILIIINGLGNFAPESMDKYVIFITVSIAVFVCVRSLFKFHDITRRSYMNYDEYKFTSPDPIERPFADSNQTRLSEEDYAFNFDNIGDVAQANIGIVAN